MKTIQAPPEPLANRTQTRPAKIYVVNGGPRYDLTAAKTFSTDPEPFVNLLIGNRLADLSLNIYVDDVSQRLKEFDPDIDYLLVVGLNLANLLVGSVLSAEFPGRNIKVLLRDSSTERYYSASLKMLAEV